MKEEFKIIANYIQSDKSILDVGCAKGFMMYDFFGIPLFCSCLFG